MGVLCFISDIIKFRHNMAAPLGNTNAKGNPGGGRRTIKKEQEQLLWILDKWMNAEEVEKIVSRKEKGKSLSIREVYVIRAVEGSDSVLNKLSDKILPDKLEIDDSNLDKGSALYDLVDEVAKLNEVNKKKYEQPNKSSD